MPKKVFVSWSSERGKKLAEGLVKTILDDSEIEAWTSSESLEPGAAWFTKIQEAAQKSDIAIGCLTPGAEQRPWVNFEAGMLYGRLSNFIPLLFKEDLKGPLKNLQALDGMSYDDMEKLLKGLLSNANRAERHLKRVYADWTAIVEEVFASHEGEREIRSSAETLRNAILSLSRNPQLAGNECLRLIVNLSLGQMHKNIATATNIYRSPQMDYPYHLVHLQKEHRASVSAIALLQDVEQFWQTTLGDRIRDTSARNRNSRVFVVRNERQLEEHWQTLRNHAVTYDVYVLHYDVLATTIERRFVRDFSIITVNGASVLASYDAHGGYIEYIADEEVIAEAEQVYEEIKLRSEYVDRQETRDLEKFKSEVFGNRGLTVLTKKPVEMSEYVEVDDYDDHEEEHAYYPEMMDRMVGAFRERFPDQAGPYRVLELGAGTGIFTRRLARIPGINEIVAFEIDWAYHARLKYNMRNVPHVKPLNEDSRRLSPTRRFHAVFSSFADHHIKPQDKRGYLRNVRNNLLEGGLFIVGDELLRPHDSEDEQAWLDALEAYHSHIIEIARSKGQDVLVKLETAAWESGKEKKGDFKVQCAEYEAQLRESGFAFRKERIGPPSDELAEQIGGVYVYISEPLVSEVTSQRW